MSARTRPGTLIVWIRRELRFADHLALWSAVQDAGRVVPLFVVDEEFRSMGPARRAVMIDGLTDLRAALRAAGGELFVREGRPEEIVPQLLRETGADGVYRTKQYHPADRRRDAAVGSLVASAGKISREFKDQVLFEEREIVSRSQRTPFTVFTPYKNAWRERQGEIPPALPPITAIDSPRIAAGRIPSEAAAPAGRPRGGEQAAHSALQLFLEERAGAYHERRDLPGVEGTSRLSHHLASGTLGMRSVYHALVRRARGTRGQARQGLDTFLNELIWREFYYQVLANFPHVASGAFKAEFDRLEWPGNDDLLAAWKTGRTGYPIVDAAMRQLNSEGWMHNRCRMITANFLTKDLHIDWRAGEAYFMERLADGDVALNNGGWQWSAGTGNDAQPWFRIFNPTLQSEKFDPKGAYIRRYVPELAAVSDKHIHEPWRMPPAEQARAGCRIGTDYPAPIVDHAVERARTLELYGRVAAVRRAALKEAS